MVGADPGAVGDGARQFRKRLAVPLDAAPIGNAAVCLFIGTVEIAATALGDFNDGMVVLS